MKRTAASLAAIIAMTLVGTVAGQAKPLDAGTEVAVNLHNAAVASPGSVERAKMLAKNMFASVGINIVWRSCDLESHAGLCVDVLLSAGDYGDDSAGPLAEAYPFAGTAGHITARYDRVHNSAGVAHYLEPVLLGHVLVHEITHVLQCLDRHADSGVMKAHYTSEDYYDMRWKPLNFTPEDIDLLHLGLHVLQSRMEQPSVTADAVHH
jgi:hypothetical protein